MTRVVTKFGFLLTLLALTSVVLVGCGRKPGLSSLKPLGEKSEDVAQAEAPNAETLDGEKDTVEPVANKKPERGFILDPLL